jgi:hypothetical protein
MECTPVVTKRPTVPSPEPVTSMSRLHNLFPHINLNVILSASRSSKWPFSKRYDPEPVTSTSHLHSLFPYFNLNAILSAPRSSKWPFSKEFPTRFVSSSGWKGIGSAFILKGHLSTILTLIQVFDAGNEYCHLHYKGNAK